MTIVSVCPSPGGHLLIVQQMVSLSKSTSSLICCCCCWSFIISDLQICLSRWNSKNKRQFNSLANVEQRRTFFLQKSILSTSIRKQCLPIVSWTDRYNRPERHPPISTFVLVKCECVLRWCSAPSADRCAHRAVDQLQRGKRRMSSDGTTNFSLR